MYIYTYACTYVCAYEHCFVYSRVGCIKRWVSDDRLILGSWDSGCFELVEVHRLPMFAVGRWHLGQKCRGLEFLQIRFNYFNGSKNWLCALPLILRGNVEILLASRMNIMILKFPCLSWCDCHKSKHTSYAHHLAWYHLAWYRLAFSKHHRDWTKLNYNSA